MPDMPTVSPALQEKYDAYYPGQSDWRTLGAKDKAGHIVTNYHVIAGANAIEVTMADQSTWPARRVGGEPDKDLAVIPGGRLRTAHGRGFKRPPKESISDFTVVVCGS